MPQNNTINHKLQLVTIGMDFVIQFADLPGLGRFCFLVRALGLGLSVLRLGQARLDFCEREVGSVIRARECSLLFERPQTH